MLKLWKKIVGSVVLVWFMLFMICQINNVHFNLSSLISYVRTHNHRTLLPLRSPRNVSRTQFDQPLTILVIASDLKLSDDAKLIISVASSLRIHVIRLKPSLFPLEIHKKIRAKSFQMIIFEDFFMYFRLIDSVKMALDNYCKNEGIRVIAFLKNTHTLRGMSGNSEFAEIDPTYSLVIRTFATSPSPKGFFLSRESAILKVARGGQVDERDLVDQIPPCRDFQRDSLRCFTSSIRSDPYSKLLSNVTASVRKFAHFLPNYTSVLRRRYITEEIFSSDYQNWKQSWATFVPRHSVYGNAFQTVAFTQVSSGRGTDLERRSCVTDSERRKFGGYGSDNIYQGLVVNDVGKIDGIERLLFAYPPLQHWSTSILLHDAILHFLKDSGGEKYDIGLPRFIHIDIDDVFLASRGDRMTRADVMNLVETQNRWRRFLPGFTFHLGFVGGSFFNGTPEEQLGAKALIRNRHHFKWFDHTYSHSQAHLLTEEELLNEFRLNKAFSKEMDLPIADGYSVVPHHSGVYPIIPLLYRAWKEVWNINVTTTEGYPKLFPPQSRRGFHYSGVQVLPRQVCGVYTSSTNYKTYPGGIRRLEEMAFGGDLFDTILFRPVSLFMTHYDNYAQDRLALHVFERLFEFVRKWTRLKLQWAPMWRLVEHHLTFNAMERPPALTSMPLHSDPCKDARHAAIWYPAACTPGGNRLPKAVIVGPQKTGTTALLAFMAMHPNLQPNRFLSQSPFEETQYFSNSRHYNKGVTFYTDQFSDPDTGINFEKSATYFDSPLAVLRMSVLLPNAKIIVLLRDPMLRAHSWYQHQRAHKVFAALNFTFAEVLKASSLDEAGFIAANATYLASQLYGLHKKCVDGSKYAKHLRLWLDYYPANQILLIDAERLESNPAEVLFDVQQFLNVTTLVDYSNLLVRNASKYYCAIGGPYPKAGPLLKTTNFFRDRWCLSTSKGRAYNHSSDHGNFSALFAEPNRDLVSLILQHHFWRSTRSHSAISLLPSWLRDL